MINLENSFAAHVAVAPAEPAIADSAAPLLPLSKPALFPKSSHRRWRNVDSSLRPTVRRRYRRQRHRTTTRTRSKKLRPSQWRARTCPTFRLTLLMLRALLWLATTAGCEPVLKLPGHRRQQQEQKPRHKVELLSVCLLVGRRSAVGGCRCAFYRPLIGSCWQRRCWRCQNHCRRSGRTTQR